MTLSLRYAVRSDVGLLREGNEDAAYAGPRLLAVADGMGGHAAGEVASAVAISALVRLDDDLPDSNLMDALGGAVQEANRTLHDMVAANPALEGMGTTLVAMAWAPPRLALCHIGDSRAYMLRDGELFQITHDHTLVQKLQDEGRISPDEAATHPQRSLILRALDGRGDPEPDLSIREAKAGDRYLLCSDGLSGVVSAETLHHTLSTLAEPDQCVIQLVELANRGGGPDNITCIVADVVDSATAPRAPMRIPIFAGAASNGRGQPAQPVARLDTPAERANALTHAGRQDALASAAPQDALRRAGPGEALQHTEALRQPEPGEGRARHTVPQPAVAGLEPAVNGRGGTATAIAEEDQAVRPRRRWPIVTSILIVLFAVVGGGGFAAWKYTQSQYYVAADGGHVAIFRGINQRVAGVSLSSVYQRTDIPLAEVPAADRARIAATILASNRADALRIVTTVRQEWQACQTAQAKLRQWELLVAHWPTKATKGHPLRPKPPRPVVPSNCPPAASTTSQPGSSASPRASGPATPPASHPAGATP